MLLPQQLKALGSIGPDLGVVRGGPEVRFHECSTRVPPGFRQGSTRVPPGVPPGFCAGCGLVPALKRAPHAVGDIQKKRKTAPLGHWGTQQLLLPEPSRFPRLPEAEPGISPEDFFFFSASPRFTRRCSRMGRPSSSQRRSSRTGRDETCLGGSSFFQKKNPPKGWWPGWPFKT